MIRTDDLIGKFQYALSDGWGYIYGKTHEMWSKEKQAEYAREYAGDPDRENSVRYGGKWAGKWVTDCSGLFKWAFRELGGTIAHGSNSIWNDYCVAKGTLRAGKRSDGKELKPGTAVFTSSGDRHNHIGLYIGGGIVIEAQGCQAGVVTSKITNKKWTHWGELRGVDYNGGSKPVVEYQAKVIGGNLNLREQPQKSAERLCQIPDGTIVTVTDEALEWAKTSYAGQTGWVMKAYLEPVKDGSDDDMIVVNRKELEAIYDTIGNWLGLRG